MASFVNSFWFALKNFVDNFNRTTTGSLGTSSGGQLWTALRGVWFANGTQGQSNDNAATYPIASYDIGTPNTLSKIDVSGPGVGVAFWVTDANSWWAAYPFYDSVTTNTCNTGLVTGGSNPPSGSCCSGVTTNTSTDCNAGFVTGANNPPAGNCCSGSVYVPATSGTCSAGLVTNTSNPPSGSCCSGVTTNPGSAEQTYAPTASTTGGGYCCAATAVYRSTVNGVRTPVCSDYPSCQCNEQYVALYLCCDGYTISSYSCYYPVTTTYTCPSGGTYDPARGLCVIPATSTTYSCYTQVSGGSAAYYYCYTQTTTSTSYSCYTSTTSSTTYTSSIRIISSVSGTVTTDSTTSLGTSSSSNPVIASIDVTTNNGVITAKGYSSAGQVTQLGSTITRTPASPNQGTSIGIIKAPTNTGQASTVDNYSVSV